MIFSYEEGAGSKQMELKKKLHLVVGCLLQQYKNHGWVIICIELHRQVLIFFRNG